MEECWYMAMGSSTGFKALYENQNYSWIPSAAHHENSLLKIHAQGLEDTLDGGAIFYSPTNIQRSRDLQAEKEAAEAANKASKEQAKLLRQQAKEEKQRQKEENKRIKVFERQQRLEKEERKKREKKEACLAKKAEQQL
ncbi:uncharacterized protein ATNIH1004_011724 [Aspergillus tanneri]|uniref:Uncharacterized protein n=1 Tax=Aspergillus tanneri TaxID=1220188 RepID=A0A5M9M4A2_9EURO|nr:uncharacterized protein ATNIH1004_011724 [Aspergillus tanneri]KAA8641588.1 hypothetical protein ATNIH1004_011724 [Aspergillus tanneri]